MVFALELGSLKQLKYKENTISTLELVFSFHTTWIQQENNANMELCHSRGVKWVGLGWA